MVDLLQALKWLSEGKKITKNHWDKNNYIYVFENEIVDQDLTSGKRLLTGAPNWKLYEGEEND